jgi:hypothetical protein
MAALVKGSKIGWPSVASRVAAVSWISWQSASSCAGVWGRAPVLPVSRQARPDCVAWPIENHSKNSACACVMLLVSDTTTSARFQKSLHLAVTWLCCTSRLPTLPDWPMYTRGMPDSDSSPIKNTRRLARPRVSSKIRPVDCAAPLSEQCA